MGIYQRYLSKSLIFFSILFVIFFLFIESNIGFKWIFNLTSRFFIGLKVEEISGSWRDFTLKNVKYNIFGTSIKANSIHLILDTKSLFKSSTIFKKIQTNNLVISLKNNVFTNITNKNVFTNITNKNVFIKYPIIFQKIHVDKISLTTSNKINIFFFNVLSNIELIHNNIIFSPTYIDAINVFTSDNNLKKKYIKNKLNFIKIQNKSETISSFLYFFAKKSKIFIPLNINLSFLKCKKISFLDYKNDNLFKLELKAKIENNILKIKKIKINSSFFNIKSYGNIIFNKNYSISCILNNEMFMPRLYTKKIKFLFKFTLNNKFTFKLKSNNLYNINMHGTMYLDSLDCPFYIYLKSKNLLFSVNKNFILKLNSVNGFLTGKINNYSFFLKNVLSVSDTQSIVIDINGQGNLKNIFLKKIKFFPIKIKKYDRKIINVENKIICNQYILELMGKLNVIGKSNNNIYDLSLPKINLKSNVMEKKIAILGSLYYRKLNSLEIPGINLFLGNNKLFIKGSLGHKYNLYSYIYANNLDYFLPNLTGVVKANLNFYGRDFIFSNINSEILGKDVNWNKVYLKNIKILAQMNVHKKIAGKVLIDAKKIHYYNFFINSLHIHTHWINNKQRFYFLLKSHKLYINLILNGIIDNKTGNWHGYFKKINIKTFLGQITAKKNSFIYYHNSVDFSKKTDFFYKKNIYIKDIFSSFLHKTKMSFMRIFDESLISFKSELSINAKLKWISGKKISYGKIFLISNNLELEKKTKDKTFFENIDYLRLSVDLIKNNFRSKWLARNLTTELEKKSVIGYLNIMDIYNKKNIEGKFTIVNFPFSFINFFTTNFKQVTGTFKSNIKIFGTFYQPKVSADVSFKNIFVRSNNILKYITLFFPYFLGKIDTIRINQEIIMQKGNVFFTLDSFVKNSNNIEWNLLFHSKKISIVIFPKIRIKFSSKLNLHYLDSKYDIIGYIKFALFYLKINEKNFIF